jgi:NhaP-type Na+/H+ or K+/H+ antiporter
VNLTRKSRFGSRISAAAVSAVVIVTRFVWMYPATYLPRWLFPPLKRKDPSHLGNGRSCAHPDVRGGAQPLSASDIDLLLRVGDADRP